MPKADAAMVDLEVGNKGVISMYLDIPLAGVLLTYVFEFLPLAREPMEELASSLRDVQDDVQMLQTKTQQVISLRMNATGGSGQVLQWGTLLHNSCISLFRVSDDNRVVTVTEDGLYMVHLRITCNNNNSNNTGFSVLINNKDAAEAYSTQSGGYQAAAINDVFILKANDCLSVRCSAKAHHQVSSAPCSCFTIIRMQ